MRLFVIRSEVNGRIIVHVTALAVAWINTQLAKLTHTHTHTYTYTNTYAHTYLLYRQLNHNI